MTDIPIIDLHKLLHGGTDGMGEVAAEIGRACRGIGFFYVVNHGIPDTLRASMFAESARFFAQPLAVKQQVSFFKSPHNRGFAPIEGESLDPDLRADAKETFNIGRELAPDDPALLAGVPFHGLNQWPADLPGFRDVTLAYYAAMQALSVQLHKAFAIDLGLEPDYFEPMIDRPISTVRLLHYPPHPGVFDGSQYGAGPHTDYGNVTILAQDGNGGLEARTRDGAWVAARPVPGSFVCNIGDCLMRWSNDIYVSTPHRVVNSSGRERYSVAFFSDPNADAPITCLPGCATPTRPARYEPTTGAAYLRERLERTYKIAMGSEASTETV